MTKTVTGLFDNHTEAAAAIHALESRGFSESRLSIAASESFDTDSFGIDSHSKLSEGIAVGAGVGGALGALIAGLTTVGVVMTSGAGLLIAGPLVAALAGAGAGAASGGLVGGLIGLGIPEHEVKHYEDAIEKGSVLIGVECEDSDDRDAAKETFKQFKAEKIATA